MSRSKRKPYASHGSMQSMKWWKAKANKKIRRAHLDVLSGNHYRKLVECHWWPRDGKQYFVDKEKRHMYNGIERK